MIRNAKYTTRNKLSKRLFSYKLGGTEGRRGPEVGKELQKEGWDDAKCRFLEGGVSSPGLGTGSSCWDRAMLCDARGPGRVAGLSLGCSANDNAGKPPVHTHPTYMG